MKARLKPYLKYHRIFVLTLVFTYIVIMFSFRKDESRYENGQLKCYGIREGGFNEGKWIWYFKNGKKRMEGNFEHGKRKGEWKMWNQNEVLLNQRNYLNDKLNGYFADYDKKGNKVKEGSFKLDKLHGQIKIYTNNQLSEVNYYNDGVLIRSEKR